MEQLNSGGTGYQVAGRIREAPHGRRMLLLALSGYESPNQSTASPERAFDHYLVKPVDPDHLARLVSEGAASAVAGAE